MSVYYNQLTGRAEYVDDNRLQNYYQQQRQAMPQLSQPNNSLNWVQGESGAKSWLVGRGETVLLMDSENPVFYLKSSDQAGMPLPLRVFDYTERPQNNAGCPNSNFNSSSVGFVTFDDLDALNGKYDELKKMIEDMQKKPARAKKEGLSDE